MQRVALKAYAKINLGLSVLGRRSDGYHELRTIYQSVSLADSVELRVVRGPTGVHLETSGFAVPSGGDNLAVRAAELLLQELGVKRRVLLRLHKGIPPGSGLGGASSDAAAVLRALQHALGRPVPLPRLLHLAATLGSDVPFFLVGGRALGLGRGEEVYALPEAPRRAVLILFPGEGMNTAEAYRLLRAPRLTAPGTRPTIESFSARAMESSGPAVTNDFEPVVFRRFPQLAQAKQWLLRWGSTAAGLSGSGSALFGLFDKAAQARNAARKLGGKEWQVFLARTVSRREYQARFPVFPRA